MESNDSGYEKNLENDIKRLAYLLYDIFVEQERLHDGKLHDEDLCSNEDNENDR